MRKAILLLLALTAAAAALASVPKVAATTCYWACGTCGMVCSCGPPNLCSGPKPQCPCLAD